MDNNLQWRGQLRLGGSEQFRTTGLHVKAQIKVAQLLKLEPDPQRSGTKLRTQIV